MGKHKNIKKRNLKRLIKKMKLETLNSGFYELCKPIKIEINNK